MNDQTHGSHAALCRNIISWGVSEGALPGEPESGDRYVVQPSPGGVLVAAVDGIGHGSEAAAAAKIATATLEAFAHESPIPLVLRCHEELRGTRGAVMTLASFHLCDRTLAWLGVGNVEAVLFHPEAEDNAKAEHALLGAGVVGYRLPRLRAEVLSLNPRDTLIIATDGITPDFDEGLTLDGDPQHIADDILARHRKGTDDALVLVARYLGSEPL